VDKPLGRSFSLGFASFDLLPRLTKVDDGTHAVKTPANSVRSVITEVLTHGQEYTDTAAIDVPCVTTRMRKNPIYA
jgi:hypothetical protein